MTLSSLAQPRTPSPHSPKTRNNFSIFPEGPEPSPLADGVQSLAPRLVAESGTPWYPSAPMRENIRLLSSAGTGYSYYTKKNKRTQTNKLEVKKYDPVVRKHVAFKEAKMPPHSK